MAKPVHAVLITAAGIVSGAPAHAQEAAQAPAGAAVRFNIPAQSLAAALDSWALQANAQIFFEPGPLAHLTAPAVSGVLRPRQALRALLARTNLEFVQGAGGVFIVRPRQATPLPAPAPAPVVAPPPATPAPRLLAARELEGPWVASLRGVSGWDDGGARSGGAAGAAIGYFLSDHVAGELSMISPQVHELSWHDPAPGAGARGSLRLLPTFMTVKYSFIPESRIRPYAGFGINVTSVFDGSDNAVRLGKTTVGPVLQAGMDWKLSDHWLLNLELDWARVSPTVTDAAAGGAALPELRINPFNAGIGISYRFGGGFGGT